ncbi:MAG: carbohydrate porin [Bacteroidetes bacterium]|nr:carbohydrate porin [Bacteroidota bacterium]
MNYLKSILAFLLIQVGLINIGFSQKDSLNFKTDSPFTYSASYIGDLVTNHSGGLKTGANYLGLANFKIGFDPQKAGLWKNGYLFLNAANTHGGEPSANLVGDFQGVSNIEAGNLSFLYELWYKQTIQNFTIIIGLQDLNAQFATSEYGGSFVNSSFGIHASIADNITAPIFPLTALGLTLQWNISKQLLGQVAIFDGTPDNFETNPYNLNWKLSKNDGMTGISEFQFTGSLIKGLKGTYKVGAYFHEHNSNSVSEIKNNYGFYFVGDQQVFLSKDNKKELSVFTQIGLCPKDKNTNNRFISMGTVYRGLFKNRVLDEAGIAFAYAGFSRKLVGNETAIELNYRLHVSDNIFIKPDFQYIINPAGTDNKLKNAFVSILRFGINF